MIVQNFKNPIQWGAESQNGPSGKEKWLLHTLIALKIISSMLSKRILGGNTSAE